jgi:hypothetical protein
MNYNEESKRVLSKRDCRVATSRNAKEGVINAVLLHLCVGMVPTLANLVLVQHLFSLVTAKMYGEFKGQPAATCTSALFFFFSFTMLTSRIYRKFGGQSAATRLCRNNSDTV